MEPVLVGRTFVGMERNGIVDLATVKFFNEAFFVVFIVFIEQLLHLRKEFKSNKSMDVQASIHTTLLIRAG